MNKGAIIASSGNTHSIVILFLLQRVVLQTMEATAVICNLLYATRIEVLGSGSPPQVNQAFYPFGVGKLAKKD